MGCEGYRPTSGEIIFAGKIINDLKIHKRAQLGITMSWQEPVRLEGVAVKNYLTLKNKDADPYFYLELVGLHPELYFQRMVDKSLSGGERKRIELVSILALNPGLAILDEPDSGMITIKEEVALSGENARGPIKTRVALEDDASAEITGITEGKAEGACGHVDCMEIVKDNATATAKAIPIVNVTNPLAKVTHEAAIGSVDKRQLETLMAHGLTPEEAVDVIVKGVLR
jgi:hypothetical protein